jgi:hypothetical protein
MMFLCWRLAPSPHSVCSLKGPAQAVLANDGRRQEDDHGWAALMSVVPARNHVKFGARSPEKIPTCGPDHEARRLSPPDDPVATTCGWGAGQTCSVAIASGLKCAVEEAQYLLEVPRRVEGRLLVAVFGIQQQLIGDPVRSSFGSDPAGEGQRLLVRHG